MGRIYKRGAICWGYWTDAQGAAQRRSLRTKDPAVARARLRELELATSHPTAYTGHTLGQALEGLARAMTGAPEGTVNCYAGKARHLVRVLGADLRLASLTRDRVQDYERQRRAEDAHPSSIAKECVVLRRALSEAIERKLWTGDPRAIVPSIRFRYEPRERWLIESEAAALLAALPPHRRLWAAIGIYAGLRDSEIERLEWSHIDLARGVLRAPGRKTVASWRRIPIAADLALLLSPLADGATGPVVEPWASVRRDLSIAMTTVIEGAPRRRRSATDIAEQGEVRPRPEAAHITPNDLRRTFASWLIQRGVERLVVAHLLGHSSTRMVERVYGRLADTTYRDAVDLMPRLCTAGVQQPVRLQAGQAVEAKRRSADSSSRNVQVVVPKDRVELPTRGFSVCVSTKLRVVK